MENKGFEFGVDATVLEGPVQWNVSANISRSRNKVLKLYGGQDILGTSLYTGNINDVVNLLREGQPMGIFYGYKEIGYNDKGIPVFEDGDKSGTISAIDKDLYRQPQSRFYLWLQFQSFLEGI